MTISAVVNRASFTGNGVTTAFAFPYPFHAQADLIVISTVIATGVQTTKALTTDYTISGSTDAQGHYPDGGSVNFLTAPAATESITIYRDPSIIQSVDQTENDPLPVESALEAPLDLLTMICQRLSDRLTRALRQPEGDTANIDLLPAKVERASMYLAFDSDGDPIATEGTTEANPVSTFMATVLDDITAAAARTTLGITDQLAISLCDFRLTLTSGTPITTADVTGAGTLYCSPYKGNRIALYDGVSAWNIRASAEFSLALVLTSGKPYDIFCYDNAGVPTLEALVWTNDTTRATALTLQNGVLVKSGATTRRYLGTIYASGANTTEDSFAKRYVWNYYNRITRPMKAVDTTNTWTYSTASYQQADANAANQLAFVIGWAEDAVLARVMASVVNSGATLRAVAVGIGLDSTTVNSAAIMAATSVENTVGKHVSAEYRAIPAVGRHTLVWLEQGAGLDTQTWQGDNGGTTSQYGITGEVRG